jgi:PAS domain S-box-containing protein
MEPTSGRDEPTILQVSADEAHAESFAHEASARSRFDVLTVETAAEALSRLRSDLDIVCIVSDHDLPGIDGIAFLEAVRAQDPEFPFILFTSEGGEEFASRAIHARVTDYLVKERSLDQWDRLLSLVEQAIAFHERTREVGDLTTRVRVVLEAFPDAAVILQDESVVYATQKALGLFGAKTRDELDRTAVEALVESDPGTFETAVFRQIQAGTVHVERATVDAVTLDGRKAPVELTAVAIEWEGSPASLLLCRDITGQIERETANEQLRVVNRIVHHDIRNDLSVIDGWARLLEPHVDEEGEDLLAHIHEATGHVFDLTETVRDFVRAMESQGEVVLEPVALGALLEAELEKRRELHPGATLELEGESGLEVLANGLLSTVFRNLINNAIVHNDADRPEVRVTVEERGEWVDISVADNGPGIPDAQKETVLGRGEAGLDAPGAGVGLYLVDMLVERYGGTLEVEDDEPEGTVFRVTLQRAD